MTANSEPAGSRQLSSQDLAALGSKLAGAGYKEAEIRTLLENVRQVAAGTTLAMTGQILDSVQKIQSGSLMEAYRSIQALPGFMGYVSRAEVLSLLIRASKYVQEG